VTGDSVRLPVVWSWLLELSEMLSIRLLLSGSFMRSQCGASCNLELALRNDRVALKEGSIFTVRLQNEP